VARKRVDTDVVVVGAAAHPLRDAYHFLLEMRWSGLLAVIAAGFLLINAIYALAYLEIGGVAGMRPGSFRDAFFFSVQTMGTIGYGAMYPTSDLANFLVVSEAVVGLIVTALATGLVFARFSLTTAVMVFSRHACISPMDGVPTLAFRIGNDRAGTIFEARVSATLIRTEKTQEGVLFYRLHDLELVRGGTQALERSFIVMHRITERSPLHGQTPDACQRDEVELAVAVVGTDDTSLQPVHARKRYVLGDLVWGARLADILSELPDGRLEMDVRKFHEIVATEPTDAFPYPKKS
jgi:inward rectifier potassium channel